MFIEQLMKSYYKYLDDLLEHISKMIQTILNKIDKHNLKKHLISIFDDIKIQALDDHIHGIPELQKLYVHKCIQELLKNDIKLDKLFFYIDNLSIISSALITYVILFDQFNRAITTSVQEDGTYTNLTYMMYNRIRKEIMINID